ncbi:MAG TPA: hypothetical protein VNH83_27595 [Bryobacteraceae bacterium]|nr:hypothetical protein [Bryobacteraceae bacterium]
MDALISAATQINYFLVLGGTLALAAILAKLFIRNNAGTIKIVGVDVPLNYTWIAMALLTLAHAFYSWSMLVEVARVLKCQNRAMSLAAWVKLTGDADRLRVMFQMAERRPFGLWPLRLFSDFSTVGFHDLLLGMHLLLVASVFAATVRWFRTTSWRLRILTTCAALLLVVANWFVGSQWALLASDLSYTGHGEKRKSVALANFVETHATIQCTISGEMQK